MFCIVDIETTGGKFEEEHIIEIALFKFDGYETIDQIISLVNVGDNPIQPYVQKLTGISNKMLRRAPKFHEIAKRIVELTKDCVLVAHNADFDYRMLQMEFGRLGFDFQMPTVDTITWGKKLIPGLPAYGLEKLAKSLGITHTHKHRAEGDARATLDLLKLLLEKDNDKVLMSYGFHEEENKHSLSHLTEKIKNVTGVYYLLNDKGKVIFVGRSNFLNNKLNRHFLADNAKALSLQTEVEDIVIEETGNELLSFIKEYLEFKKLKPKFNPKNYSLALPLAIERIDNKIDFTKRKIGKPISYFLNKKEAIKVLANYFAAQPDTLHEEVSKHLIDEINQEISRITEVKSYGSIMESTMPAANFICSTKGRHPLEKCVFYIENYELKGYAFIELETQALDINLIKKLITHLPKDPYIMSLFNHYLRIGKVEGIVTSD